MQNLLSLHELVKARLHCRAMHEGSVGVRADTRIPPIQSYIFMARPEDLVLYKVMPTRDIVKCSSINMTNARLISSRKHKLPSQRVAYLRQTTGAKKHREYISIYSYTIVSVDTSVRSIH